MDKQVAQQNKEDEEFAQRNKEEGESLDERLKGDTYTKQVQKATLNRLRQQIAAAEKAAAEKAAAEKIERILVVEEKNAGTPKK